ncbi:MAG: hypothetical protein KAS49_04970, partial [Candidatus Cloacimonetes bacterium]|nr:hypothetical protein [Candidatus Cloacimonadota bacterium]
MKARFWLVILLLILLVNMAIAEVSFWEDLSNSFWKGILEANYKEVPITEMLVLEKSYIPRPKNGINKAHPRLLFSGAPQNYKFHKYNQPYKDWADKIILAA